MGNKASPHHHDEACKTHVTWVAKLDTNILFTTRIQGTTNKFTLLWKNVGF